jgi:hypothetical protein
VPNEQWLASGNDSVAWQPNLSTVTPAMASTTNWKQSWTSDKTRDTINRRDRKARANVAGYVVRWITGNGTVRDAQERLPLNIQVWRRISKLKQGITNQHVC